MEVTLSSVRSVVEGYLNAKVADTTENFFEQGILDSFDAMNLILVLEEKFSVKLEFRDFADNDHFKLDYIVTRLQLAKA